MRCTSQESTCLHSNFNSLYFNRFSLCNRSYRINQFRILTSILSNSKSKDWGFFVLKGVFMETRDNRITNSLVRRGKLPKSELEVYPQRKATPSASMKYKLLKLSPQQIRSIKQSPKGTLPSFLNRTNKLKKA